MGIFDFVKKQFIDVIEWNEPGNGILMFRYPMQDQEIQNGAQLTVRESQLAMFVNEGRVADVFTPGLHTVSTRTLPILTNLQNWDKAFASPFKSDVYFFSTRQQIGQKWGTATPVTVRDREFGVLRIRAYGNFVYRIEDPKTFFLQVGGTRDLYTAAELDTQLKAVITTALATTLGSSEVPFIDMAANQLKFSEKLLASVAPSFQPYGLKLESFQVESVSLPAELEKRLDERAGVAMVGDLKKYAQFQAASSIPVAAANPGGLAGAGAGIGAGLAMGHVFTQSLAGGGGQGGQEEDPLKTIEKLHELATKGIITKEEFEAKKSELLKQL